MQSSSLKVSASAPGTGPFASKFKSNNTAMIASNAFVTNMLFMTLSFTV
jgi:hypothetical protein